jgi:hypothetical protein
MNSSMRLHSRPIVVSGRLRATCSTITTKARSDPMENQINRIPAVLLTVSHCSLRPLRALSVRVGGRHPGHRVRGYESAWHHSARFTAPACRAPPEGRPVKYNVAHFSPRRLLAQEAVQGQLCPRPGRVCACGWNSDWGVTSADQRPSAGPAGSSRNPGVPRSRLSTLVHGSA